MDAAELKRIQAPIKAHYREEPEAAVITLKAAGAIGEGVTCSVETGRALVEAGLHPATGGSGLHACSGDMLLEALVACAGVTLNAVATALELKVRDAKIRAVRKACRDAIQSIKAVSDLVAPSIHETSSVRISLFTLNALFRPMPAFRKWDNGIS